MVPMSQETDMRIQHDPTPCLPVARVHAGVYWGGGGGTPCVRTSEGVDKGEICMNSCGFAQVRANFLRNLANSYLRIGYRLAGFWHFLFWAPFGMLLGRDCHWMMHNDGGA